MTETTKIEGNASNDHHDGDVSNNNDDDVVSDSSATAVAPTGTTSDDVNTSTKHALLSSLRIGETIPLEHPIYMKGKVVKGFGRGSKLLGIPTANLSTAEFMPILQHLDSGVFVGWASVSGMQVHKTVMSIGWNPYFNNKERTIEPYIMHKFNEDFYGEELRLVITGFIRPEANFPSLEALIDRIHTDIKVADAALEDPEYKKYKYDAFFCPDYTNAISSPTKADAENSGRF